MRWAAAGTAVLAAVFATGCEEPAECADACSCDAATPRDDAGADEVGEEEADTFVCEPADAATPFSEMYQGILERLTTEVPVNEGDWGEDFGDATAFAPPALLSIGFATCDEELIRLANETLAHEEFLVRHYLEVMDGTGADEVLIGGIGLIEAYRLNPDPRWATAAERLMALLRDTVALFGDYLDSAAIDVDPYGPTAVTGIVAAELLRYVEVVDPAATELVDAALHIAAAIDEAAWDATGGFYRSSRDNPVLDLYPNVAMMIVWTLAYRHTGDPAHLARAEALFDAIQPLRLDPLGAYHSLYSSSVPDYVSLSSQNYLVFGLQFLDEDSGDPRYLEEATTILNFVQSHLYDNGMAWHHWENAERATWYCTGCNFQLLYDLWMLR
jgi:hypothetical protein